MSDPSPVWLVQAAQTHVQQPFYAALDAGDRPCWTDQRSQAKRFPSEADALALILDFDPDATVVPA